MFIKPGPLGGLGFFHMPVFFILAGYTFRPQPWLELLSGSVSRLLVPYVVLALAWQVPMFLMSGAPLTSGTLVAGLKTLVFASGVVCVAIAFCGLSVSRLMGVYLPLDLDLSCYILLLMWVGYTARQRGLEPSVSKPLLFIGAGVAWLVLAALSGLELSSRCVDGFVVEAVAALAGSYCVCWVSMALEKLKEAPVLGSFEQALAFCGQSSLAIFAIHAVDWFIPWQTMPLLMTLPASWLFASIVRCACDIGLAYVIKKA